MGYAVGGKPRVSMCDNVREWSTVPKSQKRGLSRKYQQHCDCKVEVCWSPKCMKKRTSPVTCRWNPREDLGRCYSNHAFCKRRSNGKCRWSKPKALKSCIATAEADSWKEP